mmetsp:Transcript_27277/g.63948  ORF Transcript_27277/g.63948 Transcript_27277/m.63948 type:complete len:402 (+) Transcript_27277:300-1505(+)|eukprot:CAMPEP_0197181812 /NCGR_PEP_ID=MMETSP1423-20130617/5979_1 /TAXON_ID=476441 /ORGANISM="Pseudo-nitzschia heimii, Strain UNC1101" /LENGTH=401 /DNA_ID=CAMNT_0042632129 /DNA_START=260 /DNA_END=1465 /DNA_ORIENTATION=-
MSETAGFQYTPPSYLLRASETTNRPWKKTDEKEDNDHAEENEYDLPQEQRPQTRRQSHLDAHFQQRVRNKQSRYRTILKGEADLPQNSDEEDDSVLAAAKNADSFADVHSAKLNVESASHNEQARKNRKERIAGVPSPRRNSSASNAENARNLRAHRLRNSLLKQTPDEYDLQHKLEMRRLARKDEEAAARRAEREAQNKDPTFENDTISRSKDLQKKRDDKAADREAMARAKQEAAIALIKAAKLNEERIRQRDRDLRLEKERDEEERMARKERGYKKKKNGKKHRNKTIRTKNYSGNNSDGDTFMTDFDAENDFAFLNDLSGIVRDSTIVKSCGSCFNPSVEEEGEDANSFKDQACKAISSVFVPDLVPSSDTSASDDGNAINDSDSVRRSREYARYRE